MRQKKTERSLKSCGGAGLIKQKCQINKCYARPIRIKTQAFFESRFTNITNVNKSVASESIKSLVLAAFLC